MKFKTAFLTILLLLIFAVTFFLLQAYDKSVEIFFGDYLISTNSMFLCLLVIFGFFIFSVLLRIIFLPFKIIEGLIDNLKQKKQYNIFKQMMSASQYLMVGDSSKALKIIQNVLDNNVNLSSDVEECLRLMFLKLSVGFNLKIHYMNKLLQSDSKFKFFIARDLAKMALQEKSYHYSLEFSLIAFEINSRDIELLELMIDIYATLESWTKMGEIIEILRSIDRERLDSIKVKISTHYLNSAKRFIGLGELQESVFYLKKCLEYKPDFYKCIELISNIHLESKEIDLKAIIENAFALSPSFDLFMIYYQNYKSYLLTADIYNNLVASINKNKHKELVIAIAYFLNMKQELDKIVLPVI